MLAPLSGPALCADTFPLCCFSAFLVFCGKQPPCILTPLLPGSFMNNLLFFKASTKCTHDPSEQEFHRIDFKGDFFQNQEDCLLAQERVKLEKLRTTLLQNRDRLQEDYTKIQSALEELENLCADLSSLPVAIS